MPKVNTSFTSIVPSNVNDVELEIYLARRFSYYSIEDWKRKINNDEVLLNGEHPQPGDLIKKSDEIKYLILNFDEDPVAHSIELIYEDNDFAILGKPAPVPIQRTSRVLVHTFVNQARLFLNSPEATPLHRLDAETSGLILVAKKHSFAKEWQNKLNHLLKRKIYLAVVEGQFTYSGRLEVNLAEKSDAPIRSQMFVTPEDQGKKCITSFHPVSHSRKYSLILVELHSGRKHQIRVSCKHLGNPIVGDKIYNHNGEFYLKRLNSDEGLTQEDYACLNSQVHLLHSFTGLILLNNSTKKWFFSYNFNIDFQKHLLHFPNWELEVQHTLQTFFGVDTNESIPDTPTDCI